MSLKVDSISEVPEDTAHVAQAVFRKGNRHILLRDTFGDFFSRDDFQALFHTEGHPAIDPARLALITILQVAEKLSDERMADAVLRESILSTPTLNVKIYSVEQS